MQDEIDPDFGIEPAFGHYFAGFVDGEGWFGISPATGRGYCCRFGITLRADDIAVLLYAQGIFGGRIEKSPGRGGSCPQCRWTVVSRAGCARVVEFFDRYPLRAKKSRDFAIWREAVAEQGAVGPGNRYRRHDWSRMEELKAAIAATREFDAPDVVFLPPNPLRDQLTFP